MKKITFKNLPDKTTPISANNLNQLQNNVEEAILNPVVESIKSENQFNKDDCVDYYYLDYNNGQPVADINMSYMKSYIPVKPNEKYTMSYSSPTIFVVYEYDSNKTFLRNKRQNTDATSFTVTISEDTYFVRLACGYDPKPGIVFAQGDTAVSYTPFKRYGYNSQESMGSIVVDDISCKNKFNINNLVLPTGNIDYSTGTITVTNYANASANNLKQFAPGLKPGKEYILKFEKSTSADNYFNLGGNYIWQNGTSRVITQADLDSIVYFYGVYESSETVTIKDIQIVEDSTTTNYSKYKGIGYTSGQNANGKWVKYDDGRLECWGKASIPANQTNTTITFPIPFLEPNKYGLGTNINISITDIYTNSYFNVYIVAEFTNNNFKVFAFTADGGTPTFQRDFFFNVKGFWK